MHALSSIRYSGYIWVALLMFTSLSAIDRPLSLAERVYHTLREHVCSGQLSSGQALQESAIAAQLGVSRTPVREALEGMANAMPGVQQSYAIQAGRELRIIVKPEQIDDLSAINLSKMIARKIEENLEYPGQIKVTVIREQRAVEYAK